MARRLLLCILLSVGVMWAQDSSAPSQSSSNQSAVPAKNSPQDSSTGATPSAAKPHVPDLSPPRSDRVNADDTEPGLGESSSKDTQIDLTPPTDDARKHPQSSDALLDAEESASGHVNEFHSWDPHKAAKSVEVGDFYFKRKNYRAAEDRYREALAYKDNDAVATFRLAVCLEKLDHNVDARSEYESYLKILPHGPLAEEAQKAIDRIKGPAESAKQSK